MTSDDSSEYTFSAEFDITDSVKAGFNKNGYIIVRNLLDADELTRLRKNVETGDAMLKYAFGVNDGADLKSSYVIWSHPGNDVSGMVARSEKVAGFCSKLLEGEVYHYHTKIILKNAFTGGQFMWHQDYGYWYLNGCLRPDLMTAFIAYDKCTKENGCLKVIKGSHKCGRVNHKLTGGQMRADPVRAEEILTEAGTEGLVHVELEPGDCLFFHSNVLHSSSQNRSANRRWAFLCCYCRADNNPLYDHHHPKYTPLDIVPNSAIRECTNITDLSGKDFMIPKKGTNANYKYDGDDLTQ